jgi:hypothetical protein
MVAETNALFVIKRNKTVFIAIGVLLLVIELTIFAVAAVKSGEHYMLQFVNADGHIVFETDGRNLTDFNKYHFEKTHGPLRNFERKLVKTEKPFPFRAWFVASIGLPLGLVLCFVFLLKAYTALFYVEEKKSGNADQSKSGYESRLEKFVGGVQKFNIFVIGGAVFLLIIAYWVLPNLVVYLGEVGVDTVIRFRWVLVAIGLAAFALLVFVIYLKFLLAKKSMDSQVEIDKHRLELEYKQKAHTQLQLENDQNGKDSPRLVDWEEGRIVEGNREESA